MEAKRKLFNLMFDSLIYHCSLASNEIRELSFLEFKYLFNKIERTKK